MAKQKLELTFMEGLCIGTLASFFICGVIIDGFFVNKNVFSLKRIYVNGKIYKLCEDK